jgi:hypothetical protein
VWKLTDILAGIDKIIWEQHTNTVHILQDSAKSGKPKFGVQGDAPGRLLTGDIPAQVWLYYKKVSDPGAHKCMQHTGQRPGTNHTPWPQGIG